MGISSNHLLLVAVAILVLLPQTEAFGAGNIASISKIEGKNWRHGDIEDMLATVACLRGHKWKSNMIKVSCHVVLHNMNIADLLIACILWQLASRLLTSTCHQSSRAWKNTDPVRLLILQPWPRFKEKLSVF